MSKFYKSQWFGRAAEFPNSEDPKDEFYEGIRRINDSERIAVEKYMSQEFDFKQKTVQRPGFDVRCDMNLHPYYVVPPHQHCCEMPQYHNTNEDTFCDYWKPTEKDIVNVKGYNATNVRIMHQVSKRIADYTHALDLINDLAKPLDLQYLQCRFPTVDSSIFRTILSVAFTELLKQDVALNRKLQEQLMFVEEKKTELPTPECGCKKETEETCPCKPKEEHPSITCDCENHDSFHRPEYTNYPKLSESFVRRILKQIYHENNWDETELEPKKPETPHEDKDIPNGTPGLIDTEGTVPTTPAKPKEEKEHVDVPVEHPAPSVDAEGTVHTSTPTPKPAPEHVDTPIETATPNVSADGAVPTTPAKPKEEKEHVDVPVEHPAPSVNAAGTEPTSTPTPKPAAPAHVDTPIETATPNVSADGAVPTKPVPPKVEKEVHDTPITTGQPPTVGAEGTEHTEGAPGSQPPRAVEPRATDEAGRDLTAEHQ